MTLDLLLEKEERAIRSTLELLNDGERLSGEDWRPVLINENERQLRCLAALRKAIVQRNSYVLFTPVTLKHLSENVKRQDAELAAILSPTSKEEGK